MDRLRGLAVVLGATPAQLALAWLLNRAADIVPIPGTKRRTYLHENLSAADLSLTGDHLELIEESIPAGAVVGERYDPPRMAVVNL